MNSLGDNESKGGWRSPRRKRFLREHLISSIRLSLVLAVGLFSLSLQPILLHQPGMWDNYVLSDWIPPHSNYPELLKGCVQRELEEPPDLWDKPPTEGWSTCTAPSPTYPAPEESDCYLQVWLEGGLNQQRIGVCNAVALARLLNATLLLPELEVNLVWQDTSQFAEIFDVDFFIESLKNDVRVVRRLPADLGWSTREYYKFRGGRKHPNVRIRNAPMHAPAQWYLDNVLPVLRSFRIAAIAPFTHRLGFDDLPTDIQKLRCRVNFHYLRFVADVEKVGHAIISRLQAPQLVLPGLPPADRRHRLALLSGPPAGTDGVPTQAPPKFLALHLRFDKDMVAHSSCDFGGGLAERRAMRRYRNLAWQNRVKKLQYTPEELRKTGRCPLTPEEVGLMLAALGFSNRTRLYLASYKVYGGEDRMAPLRQMFPLLVDKRALLSPEEIRPYLGKASRMAAIDFLVSQQSDVFISGSAGNMRNVVSGHRQYSGVKKTINPSLTKLAEAFTNETKSWASFKRFVVDSHQRRVGQVIERTEGQSLYSYPAPDCLCRAGQ